MNRKDFKVNRHCAGAVAAAYVTDSRTAILIHSGALITQSTVAGEAVLLGLASGPACMASCGPVLVPWLMDQQRGFAFAVGQLAMFLSARFAGYLLFAAAAWSVGLALPANAQGSMIYAIAHLMLAVALVLYAGGRWHACAAAAVTKHEPLVTINSGNSVAAIGTPNGAGSSTSALTSAPSRSWPLLLGFLTGLSLCPPFLVAGLRAAELRSLPLALAFFSLFFLGTLVWFAPFVVFGSVRWKQPVAWVARMTLFVLAAWYGYIGLIALLGRMLHGR